MLDLAPLQTLLEMDGFCLAESQGTEYITVPVGGGALEIEDSGVFWYREWAGHHGIVKEEVVGKLPNVPVFEQASYLRIFIKSLAVKLELATGADEPYIYRACVKAQSENKEICHGTARAIAAAYDDYSAGVHEFVTTGAITTDNLWYNLFGNYYPSLTDDDKLSADMLGTYLAARRREGNTGMVENWSRLWVDKS